MVSVSSDKGVAAEGPLGMDSRVHTALGYSLGSTVQLACVWRALRPRRRQPSCSVFTAAADAEQIQGAAEILVGPIFLREKLPLAGRPHALGELRNGPLII